MPRFIPTATLLVATLLAGCDMLGSALGIESPEKVAAAREGEGKAIGGACRHAGRAIEDCYALNRKAEKAAVFAGWRDMNDYMRENKIEPVVPQSAPTQMATARPTDDAAEDASAARGAKAGKPASAGKATKPVAKGHDS